LNFSTFAFLRSGSKTGKDALSASVDIVTAADVVADLGGVEGKQITSPSPP
jgi:hypothetical protein